MAYARIVTRYADGSSIEVEVGHDDGCHPDLLDELTARCHVLYREACETKGETS